MTQTRNTRGFTLVSVLVALLILTIGLLALAKAQAQLVSTQGDTANRSTALTIARGYTEVLRSRDPWTLASEPVTAVDDQGQLAVNGAFTRATTVTVLQNNLLQVQVDVTYPRGQLPVNILTMIYRGS
jgi:type IV pilus assembly protein PilV